MTKLSAVVLVSALLLAPTLAEAGRHHNKWDDGPRDRPGNKCCDYPKESTLSVPELNGGSAALAIGLIGGLVAVARERRRKQKPTN